MQNLKKNFIKDMSGFTIYAFSVTGLYIVYMAVTIMMDLFVKKDQKKESTEEFNNSGMIDADDDVSTVVDETSDGYSVHRFGEPETEHQEELSDDVEVPEDDELVVEDVDDEDDLLEMESLESQAAYESLKAVQATMDSVSPSYQDEYRSEDFAALMAQPIKHKSRILRHFVEL